MNLEQESEFRTKQWRMLLVYNIYRLLIIILLLGIYWFNAGTRVYADYYLITLLFYLIFACFFLVVWYTKLLAFEKQVLWSGTTDIIVMVFLIYSLGNLETGIGILLNASIAVLSILAPGRIAIFFASIASCMLLGLSTLQYFTGINYSLSDIFSGGMYGAGFFATAIMAWYLASWVRSTENLAQRRTKELVNLQQLNEYIVERLQYGVIYVNSNAQVKIINSAARQFLHAKNIHKDLNLQKLSYPLYQKYQEFLKKKWQTGQSAHTILENPYLQVRFFLATYGEQSAVVIILDDMANIAQQAQQLKLASLGRFSASIAHELRNPLGAISHAVQLMDEKNQFNEEDQRLKQMIIGNCNRMNQFIKNVLQVSKREQAQPEIINLAVFLEQFKYDFSQSNNCHIKIKISNKNMQIVFDKSQLEQILLILCDNVMQHGRDQHGEAQITIFDKTHGQRHFLAVCDTGLGVPQAIRNQIFDPFFSTCQSGHGMGLFIARDLCEINQARLILSEQMIGSCFQIYFNQDNEIQL